MSRSFGLHALVRRAAREAGRELIRAIDATLTESDGEVYASDGTTVRSEMDRFQEQLEQLSESDLAIYRTSLDGLEDTLLSDANVHYRSVLDHLLQNVGTLLDDLGCFELFGGEMPATTHDFSWAESLNVKVDVIESLPLEQTRRRLRQTRLASLFDGKVPALTKQRLYRSRWLRSPNPNERCYGLIGHDRYSPRDPVLVITRTLPATPESGQAELPIAIQRTRLRDRLFSSLPTRQEVRPKLRPDDFAHLLQGILLDTRAYCYRRARDQQQREHLNELLFRVLVEGRDDVEHLRSPSR